MTRSEVAELLTVVRLLWPHSDLDGGDPGRTVRVWLSVLERVEPAEADGAVRELLATGREHAPTVGVVVQMIARRREDAPDWDEAWPEVQAMIRRRGMYRPPAPEDFSHAMVGVFATRAWAELCHGPAEGTSAFGTHYAQQREAYRALAGRARRDASLGMVGAPRARGQLRRFDPTSAVLVEGVPDD